jgi:hypothetical protein
MRRRNTRSPATAGRCKQATADDPPPAPEEMVRAMGSRGGTPRYSRHPIEAGKIHFAIQWRTEEQVVRQMLCTPGCQQHTA